MRYLDAFGRFVHNFYGLHHLLALWEAHKATTHFYSHPSLWNADNGSLFLVKLKNFFYLCWCHCTKLGVVFNGMLEIVDGMPGMSCVQLVLVQANFAQLKVFLQNSSELLVRLARSARSTNQLCPVGFGAMVVFVYITVFHT